MEQARFEALVKHMERKLIGNRVFPAPSGATHGARRRRAWIAALWLVGGVVTRAVAYDIYFHSRSRRGLKVRLRVTSLRQTT